MRSSRAWSSRTIVGAAVRFRRGRAEHEFAEPDSDRTVHFRPGRSLGCMPTRSRTAWRLRARHHEARCIVAGDRGRALGPVRRRLPRRSLQHDRRLHGQRADRTRGREWSYRFGLVYKPREAGSVYLGWGTSFNPSAESLSFVLNARAFGINNAFLAPEENDSIEIGTKWDLLDNALSINAAVFSITKDNARIPDPNNVGFNMLAGEQRVDGYSLTLAGRSRSALAIDIGIHAPRLRTGAIGPGGGAGRQPAAECAGRHVHLVGRPTKISKRFEVGGGARFVSDQLAQNIPPVKAVESYWALDAMGKYDLSETLTLKLNLTNVTDESTSTSSIRSTSYRARD